MVSTATFNVNAKVNGNAKINADGQCSTLC